ncbi:hypothetical protein SAMN05216338_1001334 [Bradyrhizobium sp. Rc2d]|uniref:hypothetical protein n=1 Tax=Bradyrhizobium sp. Rc2d TaxID=1855321 RepID=UPI00088D7588|nr:hypothetical protein [Bradyrhizobium sp. Rc2d]SDG44687.1 hypothetical protein SAMN05216338_1001334 [Bradyrhizobium sp. Rc2d]
MITNVLSDPREIVAEDVKEALLRYYSYSGRRKVAIGISKPASDCQLLSLLLEDGQRLHLTVTTAGS